MAEVVGSEVEVRGREGEGIEEEDPLAVEGGGSTEFCVKATEWLPTITDGNEVLTPSTSPHPHSTPSHLYPNHNSILTPHHTSGSTC